LIAGPAPVSETKTVSIDMAAVKQNSKGRKTGVNQIEIALSNIELAELVPEI
jgi:hypothetical protein